MENSNFIIELAKLISTDGRVNVDKYCAILELVSKHFIQKQEDNEVVEVVWGEPLRNSNVEENRKSYNKGFLDSKKEQIMDFIKWFGEQDLKRYAEGWCQPGGSNGFHYSDEDLYKLFQGVQAGSHCI